MCRNVTKWNTTVTLNLLRVIYILSKHPRRLRRANEGRASCPPAGSSVLALLGQGLGNLFGERRFIEEIVGKAGIVFTGVVEDLHGPATIVFAGNLQRRPHAVFQLIL